VGGGGGGNALASKKFNNDQIELIEMKGHRGVKSPHTTEERGNMVYYSK